MQTTFTIQTHGQGLYEFTGDVARWLRGGHPRGDGLLTLFIRHTSASLLIQENADPEVRTDLQRFFHRMVPPSTDPAMSYLTHTHEGPDDMPAHIKAALTATSLAIPVTRGRPMLGTWQGVFLWEHRKRGSVRKVAVHLSSD